MSKLTISNLKGDSVGSVEISDDIINATHKPQALQNAIVAYRSNQHRGTHSTLTKGEVAGSGKKPWRQKGTGRARAGYKQSPIWRGGGVVFGPKPHSYHKKLSTKGNRAALRLAFGKQVTAGAVTILDAFEITGAKTKAFVAALKSLNVQRGGLILVDTVSRDLGLASQNVPNIEVCEARNVNSYSLLRYPRIIVTKAGLADLQKRLEVATEAAS
jgi:large subunit ribosomal protein L4